MICTRASLTERISFVKASKWKTFRERGDRVVRTRLAQLVCAEVVAADADAGDPGRVCPFDVVGRDADHDRLFGRDGLAEDEGGAVERDPRHLAAVVGVGPVAAEREETVQLRAVE